MLTPRNVDVSAEDRRRLKDRGLFSADAVSGEARRRPGATWNETLERPASRGPRSAEREGAPWKGSDTSSSSAAAAWARRSSAGSWRPARIDAGDIIVVEPVAARREALGAAHGVSVAADAAEAVSVRRHRAARGEAAGHRRRRPSRSRGVARAGDARRVHRGGRLVRAAREPPAGGHRGRARHAQHAGARRRGDERRLRRHRGDRRPGRGGPRAVRARSGDADRAARERSRTPRRRSRARARPTSRSSWTRSRARACARACRATSPQELARADRRRAPPRCSSRPASIPSSSSTG